MLEFKDVTVYTKTQKEPRTFEAHVEGLRVIVARHVQDPSTWVISCYGDLFRGIVKGWTEEEVKKTAEDALKATLQVILNKMKNPDIASDHTPIKNIYV